MFLGNEQPIPAMVSEQTAEAIDREVKSIVKPPINKLWISLSTTETCWRRLPTCWDRSNRGEELHNLLSQVKSGTQVHPEVSLAEAKANRIQSGGEEPRPLNRGIGLKSALPQEVPPLTTLVDETRTRSVRRCRVRNSPVYRKMRQLKHSVDWKVTYLLCSASFQGNRRMLKQIAAIFC